MQKEKSDKNYRGYLRYNSMAFQMIVIIVGGTFGGLYLDKYLHTKPLFIVLLSLFSIFLAIYVVIKDLLKKKT